MKTEKGPLNLQQQRYALAGDLQVVFCSNMHKE